ncbi:MAG: GNAT family N-acetyltransferase [Pseudomonadota bacterium]|nr:GNAT family N-acetyltransferase [Pseudomonadota bacterium]
MAASPDAPAPLTPLADAPALVRDAVLALNAQNITELSELDAAKLDWLVEEAFLATFVDSGAAFLIAFDQHADYDSPNFHWFQRRYPRFVYVDRIAVAADARGRGLARKLYDQLFAAAKADGQEIIGCEVNLDPPNPASDAFHQAQGFSEVGRARLPNGKTVRYLVRRLDGEPAHG